jgi:hypothetical protein
MENLENLENMENLDKIWIKFGKVTEVIETCWLFYPILQFSFQFSFHIFYTFFPHFFHLFPFSTFSLVYCHFPKTPNSTLFGSPADLRYRKNVHKKSSALSGFF